MNIETSQTQTPYGYIWHKYRPVILRLMVNAEDAPQQYVFAGHEFRKMFPKNRGSLAFLLYIHRSKAVNNIKTSPLANALLAILQQSKTAVKLTENSTYELMLDKKFVFHVRKNEVVDHAHATSVTAASLEIAAV
jgi:hypothetical protein